MQPTHLADPFYATAPNRYFTNPNGDRPTTRQIVVHHAADDYPPGQALAAIYRYHSQKWPDYHAIAYHEVIQIEADGSLRAYQTNPPSIIGAGVYGQNDHTYHICAATDFGSTIPLQLWQDAIAIRVAAAATRYPTAQIVGHQDITLPGHATSCPGAAWPRWKAALIARVAALNATPRTTAYVVRGVPIYQRQDRTGPLAGYLALGEAIAVDATYPDGGGHLADGRGFIDMAALGSPT